MNWLDELDMGFHGWRTWRATADVEIEVFCCRGCSPGPLVLITAGVHGDEYEGPAAVLSLPQALSSDSLRGTVIAVPVTNPGAFSTGTRLSPQDGLNLARTFPGNSHGGWTERLAAAIFEGLATRADRVIDLHSGGVEYLFFPVAGFYGEPRLDNASFRAARTFGLPALWQLPPTEGVLSYEASKRGKIAIGAEYLGAGQLSNAGVREYRDGVLSCLSDWGLLAAESEPSRVVDVFEGDWDLARASGIFTAYRRLGDAVKEGTSLGATVGARGQMEQEFFAPHDGVVLGLRSKAYIRSGDWAILVGKRAEIDG